MLLVSAAAIVLDGLTDNAERSEVGIVLGSKVMPDGRPSARLRARLDKTAELYRQGMFEKIIVSGGIGREGYSEAAVMADYLVGQLKIPAQSILLDEHGDTTIATARNSALLMKAQGLSSAVLVTQYFHVTRSKLALRAAGISTVLSAHPTFFEIRDFYSIAREVVALPVYWVSARLRQS